MKTAVTAASAGRETLRTIVDVDIVFLGNCVGPNRRGRFELVAGLPFRTRVHGRVDDASHPAFGGYLDGDRELVAALHRARCAVSIPQHFASYRGSSYDFP